MNLLANWPMKLSAIAGAVLAIMAIITFISSSNRAIVIKAVRNAKSYIIAKRYMTILRNIVAAIMAILIVIVFITTKRLPDVHVIRKTVRKVCKDVGTENMASLSGHLDNIIHTIINYQKDPDATRNRIYEDALRKAADRRYVFYIPQKDYYITARNRRNDERLLTEEERIRIKNSLDDIVKRSDKRDQISLMNEVLSDIRVTEELWMPKERLADLTPLDLIGVVGGYIGEIMLKY